VNGNTVSVGQTLDGARRQLTAFLKASSIESPALDARILMCEALGLDLTALISAARRTLSADEAERLSAFAARRASGEPVARIVGHKEFWGLTLQLSAATLVPRPDTETVVDAALKALREIGLADHPLRIADLGTGSGAILLALLSELRESTGIGTDINLDALTTARLNAKSTGLAARATFVACDYAAALAGGLHLVVSNPPYIRSTDIATLERDVRDHDPHLALDGGNDGLDAYRSIVPQAAERLAPSGFLIVEAGRGQSLQISQLMADHGLSRPRRAQADLAGVPRAVIGQKAAF